MIRRPPGSTRTDTLFPYTTLFRSVPTVLTTVVLCWLMLGQNHPPRAGYRVGPDQDSSGWSDGLADGLDSAREHLHSSSDSLREGFHHLKDKADRKSTRLNSSH